MQKYLKFTMYFTLLFYVFEKIYENFKMFIYNFYENSPQIIKLSAYTLGLNLRQSHTFFETKNNFFEDAFNLPCIFQGQGREELFERMSVVCSSTREV